MVHGSWDTQNLAALTLQLLKVSTGSKKKLETFLTNLRTFLKQNYQVFKVPEQSIFDLEDPQKPVPDPEKSLSRVYEVSKTELSSNLY